ncbi:hypothetical protein FPV67DRAFT_1754886 [Lyophyllum atratum]|nr:hypothetical protein FPV67DRAFT_1754886 [Lyophyllum atratum]
MSQEKFLALECDSFSVLGSLGEAKFGNPKPLEANSDLKEWSEGLKQDGGGGNCLRDRKQARQGALTKSSPTPSTSKAAIDQPMISPPRQTAKKKALSHTTRTKTVAASKNISRVSPEIWPITKKPIFRRPPDAVASVLASIKVCNDEDDVPSQLPRTNENAHILESPHKRRQINALLSPSPTASRSGSRSRSATPFSEEEWPQSDHPHIPSSPAPPSPSLAQARPNATSSSHPRPPTPAQRIPRKKSPTPSSSSTPLPTQSVVGLETYAEPLPPSSPPLPSHVTIAPETVLIPSPTISPPTHTRGEVMRRVPRPPQPIKSLPLADPIILAPNSDNSLSFSQSQLQTQSQSLSQSQSRSRKKILGSSQPVVLSQLSELARPRKRHEAELQSLEEPGEHIQRDSGNIDHVHGSLFSQDVTQAHDYGDLASPWKSSVRHDTHTLAKGSRSVLASPPSDPSETDDDDDDGDPFNAEPSSPDYGDDEASLVVNPGTQLHLPQDDNSNMTMGDPENPEPKGRREVETIPHPLDDEVDMLDADQELDEDDAQTHIDLFGPSAPLTHSSRSEHAPSPAASLARSEAVARPVSKQPSEGPDAVQEPVAPYQPSAWVLPSFLQPSSSKSKAADILNQRPIVTTTTIKPKSGSDPVNAPTPHALTRSRLANRFLPASHIQDASASTVSAASETHPEGQRQATSRNDQNSDPFRHLRPSPEIGVVTSQGTKRGRDAVSDDSLTRETSLRSAKKRRREKDRRDNDDDHDAAKMQLSSGPQPDEENKPTVKSLLRPRRLSGLLLREQKQPLITWQALCNILLETDRDRGES